MDDHTSLLLRRRLPDQTQRRPSGSGGFSTITPPY